MVINDNLPVDHGEISYLNLPYLLTQRSDNKDVFFFS